MTDATPLAQPRPAAGPAVDPPAVTPAEAGQKLLQFLQRRFGLPPALLHRWIRTGQVRLNGARCKPFARVDAGDVVRVPPFAQHLAADGAAPAFPPAPRRPLPPRLDSGGDLWVFDKPAGLPVHPGTGHDDSLSTRLAAHFPTASFCPTPAHRLDRDTSGVLLVAASYAALRAVHAALQAGTLVKEYVAWVRGAWPWRGVRLLRHRLRKSASGGFEKMRAGGDGGREACCLARPLDRRDGASLLLLRLLTGRTHQLRVQLAVLGHPVLGDGKYGPARAAAHGCLYLHSLRVTLPDGRCFACLPPWEGARALARLPEPLAPGAVTVQGEGIGALPWP